MTRIIIPRGSIEGLSTKDLMHCLGACHFQSPRAGQLNWYVPVKKSAKKGCCIMTWVKFTLKLITIPLLI